MKKIIQDENGKKMIMNVVSSMPQLPEGWSDLGLADDLPEAMAEIEATSLSQKDKADAIQFLSSTDWKVTRHRDQLDAGAVTSLSAEEFAQLLTDRQAARDRI